MKPMKYGRLIITDPVEQHRIKKLLKERNKCYIKKKTTEFMIQSLIKDTYRTRTPTQQAKHFKCSRNYIHFLLRRLRAEGFRIPHAKRGRATILRYQMQRNNRVERAIRLMKKKERAFIEEHMDYEVGSHIYFEDTTGKKDHMLMVSLNISETKQLLEFLKNEMNLGDDRYMDTMARYK